MKNNPSLRPLDLSEGHFLTRLGLTGLRVFLGEEPSEYVCFVMDGLEFELEQLLKADKITQDDVDCLLDEATGQLATTVAELLEPLLERVPPDYPRWSFQVEELSHPKIPPRGAVVTTDWPQQMPVGNLMDGLGLLLHMNGAHPEPEMGELAAAMMLQMVAAGLPHNSATRKATLAKHGLTNHEEAWTTTEKLAQSGILVFELRIIEEPEPLFN